MSVDGGSLTTADLERIRDTLPALSAQHGLKIGPSGIARPADMYFVAADTSLDQALEAAVATGAAMVFPEYEEFDPEDLISDDPDAIENPDVAKIMASVARHKGKITQVSVHWATAGLLCSWQAEAAWVEQTKEKIKVAVGKAGSFKMQQFADQQATKRVKAEKLVEELMSDPQFRASPARERIAVAKAILPISENDRDTTRDLALAYVSSRAAAESVRLELEIKKNLDQIATELAATAEWAMTPLARPRKTLASQHLLKITDGWSMPPALAEVLRDRAAQLNGDS